VGGGRREVVGNTLVRWSNISDWIRKKVPAEFDLSLIDLDTILS